MKDRIKSYTRLAAAKSFTALSSFLLATRNSSGPCTRGLESSHDSCGEPLQTSTSPPACCCGLPCLWLSACLSALQPDLLRRPSCG